jgi:hypothetical protein
MKMTKGAVFLVMGCDQAVAHEARFCQCWKLFARWYVVRCNIADPRNYTVMKRCYRLTAATYLAAAININDQAIYGD